MKYVKRSKLSMLRPLAASASKRFKTALADIGLLQNLCQVPANLELRQDDLLAMYRGRLAEYPNSPEGVVLYSGVHARRPEQRLVFLPLYYAGSLGDPRLDVV